jgi:rhodanese-related sulfurtransferase
VPWLRSSWTPRSVEGRQTIESSAIRIISAQELKAKLDRRDDFRLLNALGDWEFKAKRIPGSEHITTIEQARASIDPGEDVVVYCSHAGCHASLKLYKDLIDAGFERVRRFEGGLLAWEDAGLPFEGDDVQPSEG